MDARRAQPLEPDHPLVERYVPPYAIALVHLGLGDIDGAAHAIERAFEARDDPRIAAVLRRCGFR